GGGPLFPVDHLFNTPLDALPGHGNSSAFIGTNGALHIPFGLRPSGDPTSEGGFRVPLNAVPRNSLPPAPVPLFSCRHEIAWDPRPEADCANGAAHTFVSPCTAGPAPQPVFPIPDNALVEGGVDTDPSQLPYGDHHLLMLDADTCRLWELYHVYPDAQQG